MGYSRDQAILIGVVFMILPTTFTVLRVLARFKRRIGLAVDDYLILCALVCALGNGTTLIIGAMIGEFGQHQKLGPHGIPMLNKELVNNLKCGYASELLYTLGDGFAKLSCLFLYRRIFAVAPFLSWSNVALLIVMGWLISIFFALTFQCTPVHAYWNGPLTERSSQCVDNEALWLSSGILDIITDFIVLVLPIPMIWKLQIGPKEKFGLFATFLLGGIVVAVGIVRIVVLFQVVAEVNVHFNDITYYTTPTYYWSFIEASLAIVCACLPPLRTLFRRSPSNQALPPPPTASEAIGRFVNRFSKRTSVSTTWASGGTRLDSDSETGHILTCHSRSPQQDKPNFGIAEVLPMDHIRVQRDFLDKPHY